MRVSFLKNTPPNIYYRARPHRNNPASATIICTIKKGKKVFHAFSTGIFIPAETWVSKLNTITYTENTKTQHSEFEALKKNVFEAVERLHTKNEDITPEEIKKYLLKAENRYVFSDFKVKLLMHYTALLAKKEVKLSTIKQVKQYAKKLENFVIFESLTKKNIQNYTLVEAQKFANFLSSQTKLHQNTRRKILETVKGYFDLAIKWEFIEKNPFEFCEKPKKIENELVYLTESEIKILQNATFASESLIKVKDLFIFQSFTGLAYCDLERAIKGEFELEEQPNNPHFRFWLKDKRQKSQVGFIIPLLPQAMAIIQKHNGLQNIPLISNQKYNKYLKEIAEVLNIQKHLTTHVGRKTFGFYALNLGASFEVVARILGHKTIATTQKLYAKVLDPRIGEEMRKVSEKSKSLIILHISEEDKKLFSNNKI